MVSPTLRRGSVGEKVRELQRLLGITVNGQFDRCTEACLIVWQALHGLPGTGTVDALTWMVLTNTTAVPPPPATNDNHPEGGSLPPD